MGVGLKWFSTCCLVETFAGQGSPRNLGIGFVVDLTGLRGLFVSKTHDAGEAPSDLPRSRVNGVSRRGSRVYVPALE